MKPYFETENGKLYHGDCLEVMPQLKSESIDMVLTDPPYGTTACKWDSVIKFVPMWTQLKRLIKPNGAIVLFGSEPFSSALRMSDIKNYKYDWVWNKSKGTGFQIVKHKPMNSFENILIFGTGGKVTYNPQMREREKPRVSKNKGGTRQMLVSNGKEYNGIKPLSMKYPITSLYYSNEDNKNKLHPTQKPVTLMEYLIKTYTHLGERVLDFTMGSGTTAVACEETDRKWIGIEKEEKYCEASVKRIEQSTAQLKLPGF